MTITLAQLLTPSTEEEALQYLLDQLDDLGFSAKSWQAGSHRRTIIQLFARVYSGFTTTIAEIAAAGFNESSTGGWLTLFAKSNYDNTRTVALTTRGTLTLTASASAPGPFTITAGQLVFADTVNGYTYRNTTGGTLNASSTLDLTIESETAAASRDVAPSTITVMKTPLAGVTCDNPIPTGLDSWITRNGADAETDIALRARNTAKWGTLGIAPGLAYKYNALAASDSVRRVEVNDNNPRGAGTLDIYIAGDSGALSGSIVTAVEEYFDGTTDGVDRIGTCTDLEITSAVELAVPVTATIYLNKQYDTTATRTLITDAIDDYFQALPIGGSKFVDGGLGYVIVGALTGPLYAITGVQNVVLAAPTANVVMARNEVAVPTVTITYVQV